MATVRDFLEIVEATMNRVTSRVTSYNSTIAGTMGIWLRACQTLYVVDKAGAWYHSSPRRRWPRWSCLFHLRKRDEFCERHGDRGPDSVLHPGRGCVE